MVHKCWSVNGNSDVSSCNFTNFQKEITKYQNDYNNKPAWLINGDSSNLDELPYR